MQKLLNLEWELDFNKMIKKIIYIAYLIAFVGCNNENVNNCIQSAGTITQIEVEVPFFDKVIVHERIELIITEGNDQKVVIESGKNLLTDITAEVINNELVLTNNNTCNFFRDYDLTKVYLTSPNLKVIRNASEYNVSSKGVLTYPSLKLISIGNKTELLPIGNWHLTIENESLAIQSNGIAVFYINGFTNNLDIDFFDINDSRFEGENLKAQHIKIRQISSNDMIIFPVQSLKGSIHSTGDVISYNKPPIVEVTLLNNYGNLIFK